MDIQGCVIPTLVRGDDSPGRIWSAACQIAIAGAPIDWMALFPRRGRFVRLPNYPWQRERFWHAISPESYKRLNRHPEHPLLGYRLHEIEWAWESRVDTQLCPTLADHVIGEAIVMPGTGYAEMALAAARLWLGNDIVEIEHLEIRAPLILSDVQTRVLRLSIDAPDGSFSIKSRDCQSVAAWTEHAVGRILKEPRAIPLPLAPLVLPARAPDYTGTDHDQLTAAVDLDYGPAFRAIDAVWLEDGSAYAKLRVPQAIESELVQMQLHPALLDCTFQLIIQLLKDNYVARAGTVYVPASIEGLVLRSGRPTPCIAKATLRRCGPNALTATFALFDAAGEIVAWIREARFNSVQLRRNPAERLRYLECHLVPMPHPSAPVNAPRELFDRLQSQLAKLADSGARRSAFKRYTHEIEPLLDALCTGFALQALRSLAAQGNVLTEAQAHAETSSDAAPLLRRLIAILREDKTISADGNDWRFLPDSDRPAPQDIWNSLVADYPDYLPVLHAVGRVGMHLDALLMGRMTLEQVLPRECTLSHLTHRVLADAGGHGVERVIRSVVARGLGEFPTGKRLRFIEIGAGRPTFAAGICKALDFSRCDYLYATTASSIPEECHRLLENYPAAQIRLLDAGRGVESATSPAPEHFQLALVTSDFETEGEALFALAYAKRHLSPGGSILFIEQHRSRWLDFVFGARRAWWTQAAEGSWLSRHKPAQLWRQQMQKLGFQSGMALELSADGASGPYLLLSQVAERVGAAPPPAPVRNWLLLADKEGFSARLAAQLSKTLEARGDRVVHAMPGGRWAALNARHFEIAPHDPAHYETLFSLVEANLGPLDGILHLHGLGVPSAESAPLLLLDRQIDRCAATAAVVRACKSIGTRTTCWLVTARVAGDSLSAPDRRRNLTTLTDSMDAALWGFGRTLMNENSNVAVRLVDIDDAATLDTLAYTLAREISHPDTEHEVMLTASGERYVPRLSVASQPAATRSANHSSQESTFRLGLRSRGQLNNLCWESHPRALPGDDDLEIEVHATGLNFRDVMYTLGLLSDEVIEGGYAGSALGLEFAGVVRSVGQRVHGFVPGNRVLGFAPGSFGNRVVTQTDCVCPIPAGLSFEAAATIPSAFLTVHYALNRLARLGEGEKVLIHGAAGGVGIAAIQFAKWRGAEIFATAGTEEKRDFLRLLGVNHVLDSRSLAFADEIMALTEGSGVDVVLNSLAGEAINRNLRVLKPFGRFLELGKRDFQENTKIGLRLFRNNISYFGVDADQMMKERPDMTRKLFGEVMALFSNGVLHPLPYQRFDAEDVVDAFRHMQQSRQIGKIVVTYRNGIRPTRVAEHDQRRFQLPTDATYLVTGGLGGFGLRTAEWLASKGARNLVLVSRSGAVAPEVQAALARLSQAGVTVHAAACDVSDAKAISSLLAETAVALPPLRGIVHAASVIEDGLICNMSREQIRRVFAPKILGAHYLHQLTIGKPLDFFILFSSATTLFGNPGQGSYVAANACLEALAARRRAAGLPALCVCWGAIDDVGYLARNPAIKEALRSRMGGSAMQSAVALGALEELLLADQSGVGVMEFDWNALARFLPSASAPRFSELARTAEDVQTDVNGVEDVRRLIAKLAKPELLAAFGEMLKADVSGILRTSPEKIDEQRSLYDMGFDSLMGVELATAVEMRFGVRLPVMALSESPTIANLSVRVLDQLSGVGGSEQDVADEELADRARQLAMQHADEAHADVIAVVATQLQSDTPESAGRIIH
jgi:NADPH:quinone reductase-like Zn-dependent oxidoreductase/acyl carrier protein